MRFERSPAAKYFSKTTLVKVWEDTHQYLFTILLVHPQREVLLEAFQFQTRRQKKNIPIIFEILDIKDLYGEIYIPK